VSPAGSASRRPIGVSEKQYLASDLFGKKLLIFLINHAGSRPDGLATRRERRARSHQPNPHYDVCLRRVKDLALDQTLKARVVAHATGWAAARNDDSA
jgi:hypothetical protein